MTENAIERALLERCVRDVGGRDKSTRCLILKAAIWDPVQLRQTRGLVHARQLPIAGDVWVWWFFDGYGNRLVIQSVAHLETLLDSEGLL